MKYRIHTREDPMPVRLTADYIKSLQLPAGKSKLSVTDLDQRGLVLDVLPSGSYFQYRYTINGRQRSISIGRAGVLTLKEARAKAAEYERRIASGTDPQQERQQVRETPLYSAFVNDKYMPHVKTYKRSHYTDQIYLRNHILPVFGRLRMSEIRKSDVVDFINRKREEGLAPSTVNRLLVLIRFSFNLALNWETAGVTDNPARGVKQFKENNKVERHVSDDDVLRLKAAMQQSINPMLEPIVTMLLVTGARKGEVLNARWEDIDMRNQVWRIPMSKSGHTRYVPLTPYVISAIGLAKKTLARLIGEDKASRCPWIFANPKTGKPFVSVFYAWDTARRKAGLPQLRCHDARHSYASTLVNNGVPIYEVQKILGHQHIRTTERYAHLAPERLHASAGVGSQRFAGLLGLSRDEAVTV